MEANESPLYFSDRENGPLPRSNDVIEERVWCGLYTLIQVRFSDGSFGYRFPEHCPDGHGPYGCDWKSLERMLAAEVPNISWPLKADEAPSTTELLDLLEFCAASIGQPVQEGYHSFFGHYHLSWEREPGLVGFVTDVNRLFARNGVAFELTVAGQARRLIPEPLAEAIRNTEFTTGDSETDQLLETARQRITSPRPNERQEAVERLWDAFERIKTLEPGSNKKERVGVLLDRTAESGSWFREVLEEEALALTTIGNHFNIRHWEVDRSTLSAEQVDYLFMRMLAFIGLVLRQTGRAR